jgi:hypothetical protein
MAIKLIVRTIHAIVKPVATKTAQKNFFANFLLPKYADVSYEWICVYIFETIFSSHFVTFVAKNSETKPSIGSTNRYTDRSTHTADGRRRHG